VINKKSKIFVTGHKGLVGSSIVRQLNKLGYENIITVVKEKLDLRNQEAVKSFIKRKKPDAVINAAAKVGGILDNNRFRADYIYDNLSIQNNIINSSYINGVENLIFLGSSCIYPKICKQPIKEEYLLSGPLEKTNEPYAVAKIAGLKLCESYNAQHQTNYKCLMPCNLYGPGDNYDSISSHFFSALILKIHQAKLNNQNNITLWGTGKPLRELMYVDDLANACIFFIKKKTKETTINIGSGYEKSILQYAKFIMKEMNVNFNIAFDLTKPDGTYRKLLNSSLAKKYGWISKVNLSRGFKKTYSDFQLQKNNIF